MKKIFFAIIFFLIFSWSASANIYIENIFNWKKIKVFEYNISSTEYNFKVWVNPDYNATQLRDLMEKENWISAINWVFFCPRSYRECWGKDFTKNERYVEWLKYSQDTNTGDRVVFAWDKENKPFLFQSDKINKDKEQKIYYWLANHPLILEWWEDKIPDYDQKWLIDSKMKVKWTRNFICSNEKKTKIYVWLVFDLTIFELPSLLKDFWCYDALNLDAWWTTSMIYNWRQIVWPWRDLLDWVIIERKWLDTKKLIYISKQLAKRLEAKIENKTWQEKIDFMSDLVKKLANYRANLYEANSFNLYDSEANKTWYKIVMDDLKKLENIYLVNHITRELNMIISKYKKEKELEENTYDLLF